MGRPRAGRINGVRERARSASLTARATARVLQEGTKSLLNQEGAIMAKYLIKASYSADGLKGVMKAGGSSRVKAVETALAGVGGSLDSFYFAFGGDDVYLVVDVPDHAAAIAMAGAVGTSGGISRYETVVLLSPSEVDEAMNVTVDYAPPGS
jgi:uncharacterized protein with GYD domain